MKGDSIPIESRLLRAVYEYNRLEQSGLDVSAALGKMGNEANVFDPQVVTALSQVLSSSDTANVREISVTQIDSSMVLAKDILTRDGALLVCKGQQLTPSVSNRLMNFWSNGAIDEKIVVMLLGS